MAVVTSGDRSAATIIVVNIGSCYIIGSPSICFSIQQHIKYRVTMIDGKAIPVAISSSIKAEKIYPIFKV